jgi:transposase
MPHANTQTLQGQLDGLSRALAPQVHALLMLDSAGWHRSAAWVIPDHLILLHLPAYSSALNPAERLWKELRLRHLSNRVYAGIEALDEAVATDWLVLTQNAGQLMKLTHFHWIQSAQAQVNLCPETF